jgi:hypothetical protein
MACLLIGVGPLLLANPSTPQTPQLKLQREFEQRKLKGDVNAIRSLYQGNFYPTQDAQAYLALEGAVLGDGAFQNIYFTYYMAAEPRQRSNLLKAYRREFKGDIADCFLRELIAESLTALCAKPAEVQK